MFITAITSLSPMKSKCSVIKFRGGTVVLYPLAKYQPEVKPLHGKKVHAVIVAVKPYKPM
jgi:hypothetical protein